MESRLGLSEESRATYLAVMNDNKSIAMTAPVHMWESGDESLMAFTMPSEHKIEDLPKPNDSGVELLHVEGEVVAVLKFFRSLSPKQVTETTEEATQTCRSGGAYNFW